MRLHAARLPARLDSAGGLSPLFDQDRSRWDTRLATQGLELLERSAAGADLTAHHVEAAIAAVDASAPSVDETDWSSIVSLYDRLMAIAPPPVVALNRAIAELELRRGDREPAREHFEAALALARNPTERRFLEKRVRVCECPPGPES